MRRLTGARRCRRVAALFRGMNMRAIALLLMMGVATAAVAQTAPAMKPSLVRGTVESIDANALTIKTDAGATVVAAITPMSRFAFVEARSFSQLKPTDFVGITAVPGRNGHLRAEEVHIIPVVGMGEGQYPWDHHPSSSHASSMSSMTNGSVAGMHTAAPGSMTNGTVGAMSGANELNITYHGAEMVDGKCEGRAAPGKPGCEGTAVVDVTPETFIAAIVPGKIEDGKAGLAVVAGVGTDASGHVFLGSATFEKNGVKPEF
jgi:hypothetical protein